MNFDSLGKLGKLQILARLPEQLVAEEPRSFEDRFVKFGTPWSCDEFFLPRILAQSN